MDISNFLFLEDDRRGTMQTKARASNRYLKQINTTVPKINIYTTLGEDFIKTLERNAKLMENKKRITFYKDSNDDKLAKMFVLDNIESYTRQLKQQNKFLFTVSSIIYKSKPHIFMIVFTGKKEIIGGYLPIFTKEGIILVNYS